MITDIQYYEYLNQLADDFIKNERQTADYLEQLLLQNNKIATDLFEFRKFFIDKHDFEKTEGYLEIGFYQNKTKEDRVTFFCLEFELETVIRRLKLINICKKYDDKQTLFDEEPRLTNHIRIKGSRKKKLENELIDFKAFKQLYNSEIVKVDRCFAKLSAYLNPRIPDWAANNFTASPLFVRLNPDIISDTRLPQLLTEELQINPYNIDWNSFKFNDSLIKSSEYKLENIEISKDRAAEYWDYKIKGIKSLEISTSKKNDYRSFMIEELIDKFSDEKVLIGKCIHFDRKGFDDNDLDNQILDHLDLAINVYENETRETRLNETLKNGIIVDADFRTHILRIDKISIKSLPVFCLLFFGSMTLTGKYINEITLND
jgi:hypothetical protein